MANETVKEIKIDNGSGGFNNKPIGAEARNIEVAYDASGNIIENPVEAAEIKNLATGLNLLDNKISDQVVRAETNLIGDAISEDTSDDEANGNHIKGSYFLCDGTLAKATDNIVQNGSFINKYEKTDVGTELKTLKDNMDTNIASLTTMIDSKANSSALGTQVTYSYNNGVLTITPKP